MSNNSKLIRLAVRGRSRRGPGMARTTSCRRLTGSSSTGRNTLGTWGPWWGWWRSSRGRGGGAMRGCQLTSKTNWRGRWTASTGCTQHRRTRRSSTLSSAAAAAKRGCRSSLSGWTTCPVRLLLGWGREPPCWRSWRPRPARGRSPSWTSSRYSLFCALKMFYHNIGIIPLFL